jgi:hypothetical protein
MRSSVRFSLLALLVGLVVAVAAPAGADAAIEVEKFVGINCGVGFEKCGEKVVGTDVFGTPIAETVEPEIKESEKEGYRQAGGHVPFGVTDFTLKHTGTLAGKNAVPNQVLTHVRVDVAAGLATSPAAVPQCTMEEFGVEVFKGAGFFTKPTCKTGPGLHGIGPESAVIGEETATVFAGAAGDVTISGTLYNLVQPLPPAARASLFGAALKLPKPLTEQILSEPPFTEVPAGEVPGEKGAQYYVHTLVEGNVEWGKEAKGTNAGDYHDYFEVMVSPVLPVIRSRQEDYGLAGNGAFITNATNCPGDNTTFANLEGVPIGSKTEIEEHLASGVREKITRPYTTLLGLNGCALLPFNPGFALTPGTNETKTDSPDGITADVTLPHFPEKEIDSSQVKTAAITLPEGMTLNPSAAAGLTACTPAQARIHSSEKGTACPASSIIGTVNLNVPTLPDGSLTGNVYLGGPESGPITGPPYTIYVDAESERYDVSVRLKGETIPNETTGRVTTVFSENPEQPFTSFTLHFKGGALAPIANPLTCESGPLTASFSPVAPEVASKSLTGAFASSGCANPIPFSLSQATSNQTKTAGGNTSYNFELTRPEGNQYIKTVKTTLPEGLVGQIPKATQCTEAQASSNTCPSSSQIGTASAISGSGPTPFTFGNGAVYLTGPYNGAPFGLSIVVPAIAGPFNLGPVTTRATINIDPYTARVTTTATLPTIVKGVPIRLRGVSVSINKQGFLLNPTSCSQLATETTAISTFGTTQTLPNSTLQLTNCSALKFKPTFKAKTSARTSKANGASLETTLNEIPGQSNIKSVKVQLPKALPSRLTTLQKACPAATFENNPFHCPAGSFVGGARANTPTLPGKLQGPAILVSHASAAFPDLDLVMEANGVRTILVGNTDIKKGITTTTFASPPDVPVSSITVNLPLGAHSALAANGNLCANSLVMPTTITSQSGAAPVVQNTKIAVAECGVRVVGHKVVGNTAYLTVQTFAAGRISGKGTALATTFRKLGKAQKAITLKVPLSSRARGRHRPFKVQVRVGFVPKAKGARTSVAFTTVTF